MIEVEFLGPLSRPNLKLQATNLSNLKEILAKDESLKEWLEICAVAVNDTIVCSLETPLKSGDRVSLLPPVCGG